MSRSGGVQLPPGGGPIGSSLNDHHKKNRSELAPETRDALKKTHNDTKTALKERVISAAQHNDENQQNYLPATDPTETTKTDIDTKDTDIPPDRRTPKSRNKNSEEIVNKVQLSDCTTDSSSIGDLLSSYEEVTSPPQYKDLFPDEAPMTAQEMENTEGNNQNEITLTIDNSTHDAAANRVIDRPVKMTKERMKKLRQAEVKKEIMKKELEYIQRSATPKEQFNKHFTKFWIASLKLSKKANGVLDCERINPFDRKDRLKTKYATALNNEEGKIDALNLVQHVKGFMREAGLSTELDKQIYEIFLYKNGTAYDRSNDQHQAKIRKVLTDSYIDFLERVRSSMTNKSDKEAFSRIIQFARWQASTLEVSKKADNYLDQSIEKSSLSEFQKVKKELLTEIKQQESAGRLLLKKRWPLSTIATETDTKDPVRTANSERKSLPDCVFDRVNKGVEGCSPGLEDLKKQKQKFEFMEKTLNFKEKISKGVNKIPFPNKLTVNFDESLDVRIHEKEPGKLFITLTAHTTEAEEKFINNRKYQLMIEQACKQAWFGKFV